MKVIIHDAQIAFGAGNAFVIEFIPKSSRSKVGFLLKVELSDKSWVAVNTDEGGAIQPGNFPSIDPGTQNAGFGAESP